MIYSVVALSLVLSALGPWYLVVALAAGVYSFRKKVHSEILLISLLITVSHVVVAFALDLQAHGLVSKRISGLFHLPIESLSYILVGLIPGILFLTSSYVMVEGRTLARKRERKRH